MDSGRFLITIKPAESRIPEDIYNEIVSAIDSELGKSQTPDDDIAPYIYPIENIQKIADSDNIEYKEGIRSMADDLWGKEDWFNALMVYYILMHIIAFAPTDFYKLAYSLAKLGYKNLAEKILFIYEPTAANKKVACHAIANFYYTAIDSPLKAVDYFEKYLEFDPNNAQVYNTLAHLYSRIDDEVSRGKCFEALLKAYELKPDDAVIVKSLLTYYEKQHNIDKVKEFYPKLIALSPSPRHSLNYGLYLMSWGKIKDGGKYFLERFDLDNYPIGYPKGVLNGQNKWNYVDDISDKMLVVHYEEGFGDSIMYSRFLPLIRQFAKKTVFISQPELVKLFTQSPKISEGIEIFGDIKDFISKYAKEDYVHIPLLDLPYVLGIDSDFIPYSDSYLFADKPKMFDKLTFNIGLAYSGDINSNYNNRNINIADLTKLSQIGGVKLYSLQVGEASESLSAFPPNTVFDLSKGLKEFTDTANAIAGLDLVVTTDNVILNLAGALRKKTLGLFNKYPNYRWFDLTGEDVVWYKSVKPFQCAEENGWDSVISDVEAEIKGMLK